MAFAILNPHLQEKGKRCSSSRKRHGWGMGIACSRDESRGCGGRACRIGTRRSRGRRRCRRGACSSGPGGGSRLGRGSPGLGGRGGRRGTSAGAGALLCNSREVGAGDARGVGEMQHEAAISKEGANALAG